MTSSNVRKPSKNFRKEKNTLNSVISGEELYRWADRISSSFIRSPVKTHSSETETNWTLSAPSLGDRSPSKPYSVGPRFELFLFLWSLFGVLLTGVLEPPLSREPHENALFWRLPMLSVMLSLGGWAAVLSFFCFCLVLDIDMRFSLRTELTLTEMAFWAYFSIRLSSLSVGNSFKTY